MAVQQAKFWKDVKRERASIVASLVKGDAAENQPRWSEDNITEADSGARIDNNVVFITSLLHNDRGTRAGFISEATVELAGQKLVEQTHRLSTEQEIDQFVSLNNQRAGEIQRAEIKKKMQFVQTVGDAAREASKLAQSTGLLSD